MFPALRARRPSITLEELDSKCPVSGAEGVPAEARAQEECPICLCDFEHGEELRRLPCGHFFHRECVDRWVLAKRTDATRSSRPQIVCPLCHQDVYSVTSAWSPSAAARAAAIANRGHAAVSRACLPALL